MVLRCPDTVAPETRTVPGGEFSVGRGPGVDWVLPDPERLLSKRHFAVAYRGGAWQLADTSTNGTFLNRESEPVGADDIRSLRDGDRLRVGAYEIEVQLLEDAAAQPAGRDGNRFDDPFAIDPFTRAKPQHAPFDAGNPFDEPEHPSLRVPAASSQLPADFDAFDAPFGGPTQDDHSPVIHDALQPPAQVGQMPLHSGGVIPGEDLLPDDWDKDLLEGINPGGGAAPVTRAPEPPPPPPPPKPMVKTPLDEPEEAPVAQPKPVAPQSAAPSPPPVPVGDQDALLAAFLEGVELPDADLKDPVATMRALGQAFRNLVSGLRAVMIARADIKSEFRIEQTRIQARGNNPLKFSADDDDALAALLGTGRRTDMGPSEAVSDALRDIRLHELASMAAMRAAVATLLEGLNPAKLRAAAEQGGMTLLPAQKKARAWEAYEALYARTVQGLSDDFDSVFGKAFARAYETLLDEVATKERE